MEEKLERALMIAGEHLRERVAQALRAKVVSTVLECRLDGSRVSVLTRSRELYEAERGTIDVAPSAFFEETGRSAAAHVVEFLARSLELGFDERGL